MESPSVIARVISHDEKLSEALDTTSNLWIGDQRSVDGIGATTESVRPIDVSERGDEHGGRSFNSRIYDCDSQAKATTVSQILDKGFSVGILGQSTLLMQQATHSKQSGPYNSINQEYYVHPKLCKKERRMSSLSMGSARASSRERYLSVEEQYEMLKLHHLNLLNEIHETALMLNLFEQRQLIREQQMKMRQIQKLQLVDNSESNRYQYYENQENQPLMGPSHIPDDEEQETKSGNNVNNNSSNNKRCMEESNATNKRRK